jgi:hypothetical protein
MIETGGENIKILGVTAQADRLDTLWVGFYCTGGDPKGPWTYHRLMGGTIWTHEGTVLNHDMGMVWTRTLMGKVIRPMG